MQENRDWALGEIDSGNSNRIINGLLSLTFYDNHWELVESLCFQYSSHFDNNVKGVAILCFGHLARIHGKLHIVRVSPVLKAALKDKSEYVRGQAENAKEDIELFLRVKI